MRDVGRPKPECPTLSEESIHPTVYGNRLSELSINLLQIYVSNMFISMHSTIPLIIITRQKTYFRLPIKFYLYFKRSNNMQRYKCKLLF